MSVNLHLISMWAGNNAKYQLELIYLNINLNIQLTSLCQLDMHSLLFCMKKYVDIYRCKRQVCETFIIAGKENPAIFKDNPQSPLQFLQNIVVAVHTGGTIKRRVNTCTFCMVRSYSVYRHDFCLFLVNHFSGICVHITL